MRLFSPFSFVNSLRVSIISKNERKLEATNSSLKKQIQELQEKCEIAQSCLSEKICGLNHQLAACNDKLHQEAVAKEKLNEEI